MKCAIFDMDGVLVDSHPIHMRAWKRLLKSREKAVTEKDLEFIFEGRKKEEILRHLFGDLSQESLQVLGRRKEKFFQEESAGISTIPGLRQFLDQLHADKFPMAVASCGGGGRVNHLLNMLQLRHYFSVVVTGDDVKEGKPDPAIFLRAADLLSVEPNNSLVFEDSVSGVQAAVTAGMRCIGITDPARAGTLNDAGADQVFHNFLSLNWSHLRKTMDTTSPYSH